MTLRNAAQLLSQRLGHQRLGNAATSKAADRVISSD
jgi:hypothetical protein